MNQYLRGGDYVEVVGVSHAISQGGPDRCELDTGEPHHLVHPIDDHLVKPGTCKGKQLDM